MHREVWFATIPARMDERMARFPTTRWSLIEQAAERNPGESSYALAELCRHYWYPVYSFIRSRGATADEAEDLTQEYFSRVLEGRLLAAADRARGRFRTLLRIDCGFFLADMHDRQRARKRGGGVRPLSLASSSANQRFDLEPVDRLESADLFDRAWALDVLARALQRLASEEAREGRDAAFQHLRDVLVPNTAHVSHAVLAGQLGMSESAVEGAVRRLRGRYRLALRTTVAETLDSPTEEEIDEEVRDLFAALGR